MTKSCVSFSNADSRSLLSFFDGERSHYTAKQWDEDVQLYYFNARWYDPTTARFMTEDPIRDGLLWYAYCNNNPLKFTDPTGLRLDDDLGTDLERQNKDPEPEPEDDDSDDDDEQEQEQSRREIEEYYDNLRNRNTFGPDPDSLTYDNFNTPLDQNDPVLSGILNMAQEGCNYRSCQMVAEYETGRNLSAKEITASVEAMIASGAIDDKLKVLNPDAVINDAFDRLGKPETTATVGYTYEEGQFPDYSIKWGETPNNSNSKGDDHARLGDNRGNLIQDPYSPDIDGIEETNINYVYLH